MNATLAGLAPQASRSNTRAERIRAGCLAAPRSAVPRQHYARAIRVLALVGDADMLGPPLRSGRLVARLRTLRPSLTQPEALAAVRFILDARDSGTLPRWLRRNQAVVAKILREVSP